MFILVNYAKAQINYVLNPSFEEYSECPTLTDQISFANHWSSIDTLTNPQLTYCSPQYFNACSSTMGVPMGYFNCQLAKSGNAFSGYGALWVDSSNQAVYDIREYVQGRLVQNLTGNATYCVKYYTVSQDSVALRCNKQGVYFDDGGIDSLTTDCLSPLTNITPQIENNTIIIDAVNWQKLEGTFLANGSERFITFGNFKSYLNTQQITFSTSLFSQAMYLIDDVSVVDYNLPAFAGTDALITDGDSVYLGRPNEIGPECRWWANGAVVDSNVGFWAKPTQPTQYVLEQKICGNVKYDTVFVNISGHDGLNSPTNLPKGEAFRLVPNPASSVVNIEGKQSFTSIEIYNSQGSLVEKISTKPIVNYQLLIANYNKGIYILKVTDKNGSQCLKLVVE